MVGLGRGSGAVTSQPCRDLPCGRVLVWLQGIPGNVSTQSGKAPVSSEDLCLLLFFLIENQITNQIHEDTAKVCPCTMLQLLEAVPMGFQPLLHPLCSLRARNGERAGTEQLLQLGKGQLQAGAELWL